MRLRLSMVKKTGLLALGLLGAVGYTRAFALGAHPIRVEQGVLTVDGMTVQTGLTVRAANLHYLYVYLPGTGTAVVSDRPFVGGHEEKHAFHKGVLTFTAAESQVQLSAAHKIHSNGSAYVRFDRGAHQGLMAPALGYASTEMNHAIWVDAGTVVVKHRRLAVSTNHRLREGKLCRPSRHGGEKCALVREVRIRD